MKFSLLLSACIGWCVSAQAQLCHSGTDTLYGLTAVANVTPLITAGQVVGIHVGNGGSNAIGLPSLLAVSSNAMGISQMDGRFYFFNQVGSGVTQFVAYNPNTASQQTLANPPLLPTNQRIRSGTVNRTGNGYYMIYPAASTSQGYPINGPALYYYNISTNTWTLITQTFKNSSGTAVANIVTLNSGDMAFDGSDNLWMLISNTTNHALYKINAPLPTTAVASVTVDTMIAQRANPVSGVSFTGIGFNTTGSMYLTTGSGSTTGCNRLYYLANVSASFTMVGTLPNSYGDDLASCYYPVSVLGVKWISYALTRSRSVITHRWVLEEDNTPVRYYTVEGSGDGLRWSTCATVMPQDHTGLAEYTVQTAATNQSFILYRIRKTDINGAVSYSPQRRAADTDGPASFTLSPNPASDYIVIEGNDAVQGAAVIITDLSGRILLQQNTGNGNNRIPVSSLPPGMYLVQLTDPDGNSRFGVRKLVKR